MLIRILVSVPLTNGSGCVSGRPKNIRILQIRIRNTGTFTSSLKIKSHKEVTKQWKSRFFLLFLLVDGVPKIYGFGSPTLLKRIRQDPDPHYWSPDIMCRQATISRRSVSSSAAQRRSSSPSPPGSSWREPPSAPGSQSRNIAHQNF